MADGVETSFLEALADAIVITDSRGRIMSVNRMTEEMFGIPRSDLVGAMVEVLLPVRNRAIHSVHRERFADEPSSRAMGSRLDLAGRRSDGSEFPVEVSLSPIAMPDGMFVIASVRDMTVRRETEAKLQLATDRERIARDLHDTVIQRVFAAGLGLQAAIDQPLEVLRARVHTVIDECDIVIRDIRSAIFDLGRAEQTQHISLRSEVLDIVDETSRLLGFRPKVTIDGAIDDCRLDGIRHDVRAVLRESLSNVVRHAQAAKVEVDLLVDDDTLTVAVTDDGIGLGEGISGGGNGLRNLADRARLRGGAFELRTEAGRGTTLTWRVPLSDTDD